MSKATNKGKDTEVIETIKDLMPETPDLNAERLAKLKELFPDLFTDEGNLSETELKKLVDPNSVNETERYEFRWFGKSNAKRKAFTPTRATLNYDEARSVNPDISENLIVEGENLKVLKLLLCSYREQIKCIYIDPPYNTGKDFVYSDNYTEDRLPYWKQTGVIDKYGVKIDTNAETDGRFHSNWLNMMFSRLLVARQLLRNDGVIFISIDDNEVHNLRRLCNEVFGEDNFIGIFVINTTPNARDYGHIGKMHEYCMFYSKDALQTETFLIEDKEKRFRYKDEIGEFNIHPLYNSNVAFTNENRPNLFYPFYLNTKKPIQSLGDNFFEISLSPHKDAIVIYPPKSVKDGVQFVWRWGKEKSKKELNREIVGYETEEGEFRVVQKMRTSEKLIRSMLTEKEYTSRRGTAEVEILFEKKIYSFPKPSELIKLFLKAAVAKEDVVLDFFAGSGVTGQAVMELNEVDGGDRKFILVQLPELTDEKSEAYKAGYHRISDITIERNKRVVNRIIDEKRAAHPNLFEDENNKDALKGLGFKVFKLETSYFPRTEWNPDPAASEAENVASLKKYIAEKESQLRIDFDRNKLLTEILLKEGFKLNYNTKPYEAITANEVLLVSDADKEALICLNDSITQETVEHFKTHKDLKFICLERALDTTKKWNLANNLGEKFKAF